MQGSGPGFIITICLNDGIRSEPTEQWTWQTDWGANRAGYEGELIHFYRCIREGLKPSPSGEEALAANILAEAVVKSSRTGEPVHLS